VKVGTGKLAKEKIVEALCNPNKKVDFGLAPAKPLILKDIVYDFDFEYNSNLLNKLDELERKIVTTL
jgi:tRNA U38,U39,U40 pseudouridine synthase TruA